jgi:hypothetical protein
LSTSVGEHGAAKAAAKSGSAATKYEILRSLSDIRGIRDLSCDAVRDILRRHTRDGGLVTFLSRSYD